MFCDQVFCRMAEEEKRKVNTSSACSHATFWWSFPIYEGIPTDINSAFILQCIQMPGAQGLCSQPLLARLFPLMLHTGRQRALLLLQCLKSVFQPFCADSVAQRAHCRSQSTHSTAPVVVQVRDNYIRIENILGSGSKFTSEAKSREKSDVSVIMRKVLIILICSQFPQSQ